MNKSFTEHSERILKERQLRLFILACIPAFVIWGLALNSVQPSAYDPFWIRALFAGCAFFAIGVSYLVKKTVVYLNWVLIILAYVLTGHSFYLLTANNFIGFAGPVILIGIVLQTLPTRKSTFTYIGFVVLASTLALLFNLGTENRDELFFFSCLGIIGPGVLFKYYSFQAIDFLKSSESEKAMILNSMSDGLILLNKKGAVTSFNPAALKILNIEAEQVGLPQERSKRWKFLNSNGQYISELETPGFLTLETGRSFRNAALGMENTNTQVIKWINCSTTPLYQDDSSLVVTGALISFSDITDLREAQHQITESQMQMASASKLTSLGEMASGIAHEVNNPLAIIQSKIFQISKILSNDDKYFQVHGHLEKIEQTVFRIQNIVKGLRSFARQADKDPFESTILKTVIDDTLGLCGQKLAQSNIVVTVDIDPLLNLDCRPGQISQILMNLLQNATDAVANTPSKRITIKSHCENGKVFIAVSDSGPGIPTQLRDKIMQPFFTTKEVGKGTGLGLSISMGIARQHRGNLYLDTSSKQTCFVLELPVEQNKNIDDFQVA